MQRTAGQDLVHACYLGMLQPQYNKARRTKMAEQTASIDHADQQGSIVTVS